MPRSLRTTVWCAVAFTLLVTLPALVWAIFPREIYEWYQGQFVAPAIEARYGFKGGTFPVQSDGRAVDVYGIATVVANGELARAGVRPGDIPVGFQHSRRGEFLDRLAHPHSPELELQFVPLDRIRESPRRVKTVRVRNQMLETAPGR